MARTVSALDPTSIALAVAYLKRELQREDTTTFIGPARAADELAKVEALMERLGTAEAPGLFRFWVIEHLSDRGRVKMLNALRRKKADVNPDRQKRRTISVPADTYQDLERLASETSIATTTLVKYLVSVGNADQALRKKLYKLAIANKSTKTP